MQLSIFVLVYATVQCLVLAHPGHAEKSGEPQLLRYKASLRKRYDDCLSVLGTDGLNSRSMARRSLMAESLRTRRGLSSRDTDDVLNTSHLYSESHAVTLAESGFFGHSGICILNPQGDNGPFWVKGEFIRSGILEDQPGVPVVLEFQFIDVSTCSPVEGLYVDTWSCNSTGIYSGVQGPGNGNIDDESNLDKTFLRGVQKSNNDGIVVFKTLFPGHYAGRSTHHHIVAHHNATLLPNNTLTGGSVPHIGQLFWDQDLINKVEATAPYNTNSVELLANENDYVFAQETNGTTSDPVLNYVYLGKSLEQGLFGWTTIVVDLSAEYSPNYSFVWTENGSEEAGDGIEDLFPSGWETLTAPPGASAPQTSESEVPATNSTSTPGRPEAPTEWA
ncbi:Intradiol ring-cleavage dioxygenase [Aspergillus pseudodeflectus]|uniref:Intradiol ring-cleavage dioxygenase n=1 Tax=Aspergillus pseudodeflectus TaxID=176178 RepID=A0ABR4JCS4_9EURO